MIFCCWRGVAIQWWHFCACSILALSYEGMKTLWAEREVQFGLKQMWIYVSILLANYTYQSNCLH